MGSGGLGAGTRERHETIMNKEDLDKWIDEKRRELDEEYLHKRQKIESDVKRMREETAKHIKEYDQQCWHQTGAEIARIRATNETEYLQRKEALESLIRLKQKELAKAGGGGGAAIQPSPSSITKSVTVSKKAKSRTKMAKSDPQTGLKMSSENFEVLLAISRTMGAKASENEDDNVYTLLPGPKVVKACATATIYKAKRKVGASGKEETIVCKVSNPIANPRSNRANEHFFNHALSIVRYICCNDGRKSARHPSFVKVYEILLMGNIEVRMFMREYNTTTLKERIEQDTEPNDDPLGVQHLIVWTRQMCDGIIYLHELGIAYLNLRPEHCLFERNDNLKLCGLSRLAVYYEIANNRAILLECLEPPAEEHLPAECFTKPFEPWPADLWSIGYVVSTILPHIKPLGAKKNAKKQTSNIKKAPHSAATDKGAVDMVAMTPCLQSLNVKAVTTHATDFIKRCQARPNRWQTFHVIAHNLFDPLNSFELMNSSTESNANG